MHFPFTNKYFCAFRKGSRHFDWLANLREHIEVEEIVRKQILSERGEDEGSEAWGGLMEECKRELTCVCKKMAQSVGWRPGRPGRWFPPQPGGGGSGGHRQHAMRTGRGGKHLFSSSDEGSGEDAPEGSRTQPSDPWLAPVNHLVERDFVWGGYIERDGRGKPLPQVGIDMIEHQVSDFHSERMNSPPKTSSLTYWAQASLRFPLVAEVARKYLCVPASSATSERSFSKAGHIVRARRAKLSDEHVQELTFLSWNQDLMY